MNFPSDGGSLWSYELVFLLFSNCLEKWSSLKHKKKRKYFTHLELKHSLNFLLLSNIWVKYCELWAVQSFNLKSLISASLNIINIILLQTNFLPPRKIKTCSTKQNDCFLDRKRCDIFFSKSFDSHRSIQCKSNL